MEPSIKNSGILPELTLTALKESAIHFARELSSMAIYDLYGTTDGKAVGSYLEQKFRRYLEERYVFVAGNAANGIDFPGLAVDLKSTSITQPQSSSPFENAAQKIFGLGYHLLLFVYSKSDDQTTNTAQLNIIHVVFIEKGRTADWQTTSEITNILNRQGNSDDLVAFFEERNLPLDDIGRRQLAERVLREPPQLGYLTISNALQWRLQYSRVLKVAGEIEGIEHLGD
jgi:restriction system protein